MESKSNKKFSSLSMHQVFKIIVFAISMIAVVFIYKYAAVESKVSISQSHIEITGMYGGQYTVEDITSIELSDNIPNILRRTNGASFMEIKKGNFNLSQIGKSKLYLHSSKGPYIIIKSTEQNIIINFRDGNKTQEIYKLLSNSLNK